jgi:hypothetical protein
MRSFGESVRFNIVTVGKCVNFVKCVKIRPLKHGCLVGSEKKWLQNTSSYFITITILDIIHRPVIYLEYSVSETGFSLRL